MNIIIPLGGIGERFINDGYNKPKPLICILGKTMIQHVIDSLNLDKDDKLIIIYNKYLNKYNFSNLININYGNVMLIDLTIQTDGAVQTILYGLEYLKKQNYNLNSKHVIIDGDTIYKKDILNIFRKQKHNAIFCFNDTTDDPIYSYTKYDEFKNLVTDIKEKCKISSLANTGCYCFENGEILRVYCTKIIKENIRMKNEYYTSCVIQEMLKDNIIFEANIIDKNDFICVGTPLQLKMYSMNESNFIKRRFCFDLDNTLVTFPQVNGDYSTVKPIYKNITFLNNLKKQGHTIIIYTARRMKTCNGNIGAVMKNICKITLDTLEDLNIQYDELYFGKPYADFYIDDLAINSFEQLEKATGFYQNFIEERTFNKIDIVKNIYIRKITNKPNSLEGEIFFYKNIPEKISRFFPKLIEVFDNCDGYIIEKINGINLSRQFTSESLDEKMLLKLLNVIKEIHDSYNSLNININNNIYLNYGEKLKNRINNFDYSIFKDYKYVYEKINEFLIEYEKKNKGMIGVIHGDPVFSNIIITENYDFKFIDMRGKIGDNLTILGDVFYDYSKLYQSLIGYDEILLGEYVSNKYRTGLLNVFHQFIINNFGASNLENIRMITNSLLFSLIPLHSNENIYKYYDLINI